jgi:hypothetical protein
MQFAREFLKANQIRRANRICSEDAFLMLLLLSFMWSLLMKIILKISHVTREFILFYFILFFCVVFDCLEFLG